MHIPRSAQSECETHRFRYPFHLGGRQASNHFAQTVAWHGLQMIAIHRTFSRHAVCNRQGHFTRYAAHTGRYRSNGYLPQAGNDRIAGQHKDWSSLVGMGKSIPTHFTPAHRPPPMHHPPKHGPALERRIPAVQAASCCSLCAAVPPTPLHRGPAKRPAAPCERRLTVLCRDASHIGQLAAKVQRPWSFG